MLSGRPLRRAAAACLVVAALVAAAPLLGDVIDDVEDALATTEITGRGSRGARVERLDVEPPLGLQRRSLLRRGNLAPALRELHRRAGGRITTLRVAPDRVDLEVVTGDGRLRAFRRTWNGETAMLSDRAAAGAPRAPTVGWADVDPSAPRRIAARLPARQIEDLTLRDAAGARWTAHLADTTRYDAPAGGRTVSRAGG